MKKIALFVMLLALSCFAFGCTPATEDTGGTPAGGSGTAVDTTDDGMDAADEQPADDTADDTP